MPFPDLEGGLSGLFKIPLVAQVDTLRLQRKGDGFAERNGLAFGLLGDFQFLRDVDRDGFYCIAVIALDLAIKLNAVPCGVGSNGFTRAGASLPHAPSGLSGFLKIPLIF